MNDKDSYEISIPNPYKGESFKIAISQKAISSIINHTQRDVSVFEGFWDCFTYLAMMKNLKELPSLYVLNSATMIYELAQRLIATKENINTVSLFLDNDNTGLKAQTQLLDLLKPHNI